MKATEIIRLAQEHKIPIHEDPDLVELLLPLELGRQIPEDLYAVVAEVLAMIYKLEKKAYEQTSG